MPGGNRTGPTGAGPMTGRAAGYCAGNPAPGYASVGFGNRGFGRGRGFGFGRGPGQGMGRGMAWGRNTQFQAPYSGYGVAPPYVATNVAPPDPGQTLSALKGEAEYLEKSLNSIKQRISELESTSG